MLEQAIGSLTTGLSMLATVIITLWYTNRNAERERNHQRQLITAEHLAKKRKKLMRT